MGFNRPQLPLGSRLRFVLAKRMPLWGALALVPLYHFIAAVLFADRGRFMLAHGILFLFGAAPNRAARVV